MPVIGIAHHNPTMRAVMRRGLRARGGRVVGCRGPEQLARVFQVELVDAVVVGAEPGRLEATVSLASRFPRVPVFLAGAFRPDDAPLLLAYRRGGVRAILVDGVDDYAAAELVTAQGASRRRRHVLRDAPRLLRLTEPLQLRAWEEVLGRAGTATTTAQVARALRVTREHLSREFAAGGAPNIKRVIDLARVLCATDLLANPGYSVATVARVLRFSSPSHLAGCTRRIAGVSPMELPRLGLRGVLGRFLKGRMRSRL
ncbi:MAG TPA: helix-turn-helix domain-containing protein [Gemmatimonadales bacterium]|jgi:AraC-like DNA-binding protein|nr:helix-turn-helix domain-containing protein [Gemmatimonadales bacterium]